MATSSSFIRRAISSMETSVSACSGRAAGEGVAQGVGLENPQALPDGEADAATCGHLGPREGHVLVCRHVVGQVEASVAHELGGPQQGVERDVVLPDEVDVAGVVVVPPALPGVGVTVAGRPFLGGRQVPDHRVVPDVNALSLAQVVDGKLYSPVEIPGDRPVLEPLVGPAGGRVEHMGAPASPCLEPGSNLLGEVRVAEVEVLGRAQLGRSAADLGPGLDQVGGVEGGAAVLALVAAGRASKLQCGQVPSM